MEQYTTIPSQRMVELIIKFIHNQRDKVIRGKFFKKLEKNSNHFIRL